MNVGEFYRIFAFRFSFWALLRCAANEFYLKVCFLIIQDLRCKFTTDRESLKYCFYFQNSRSFKWAKSCKLSELFTKEWDMVELYKRSLYMRTRKIKRPHQVIRRVLEGG